MKKLFRRVVHTVTLLTFLAPLALAQPSSQEQLFERWQEVRSAENFDLLGLQTALDYARFLKQSGQHERAEAVLALALEGVDLDRNRLRDGILEEGWSALGSDRFDQRHFVAQARDLVGPRIGESLPRRGKALRTLAELRRLQGRPQEALTLELEYLDQADLPEEVQHARRGWVLEFAGRPQAARVEYRLAYQRLVELAETPKTPPEADPLEPGATAQQDLQIALAEVPPALSAESTWNDYLSRLDRLYKDNRSDSSGPWMERAANSSELDPMARSLLYDRLGQEQQALRLSRLAVEEGFAALRAAFPAGSHENPFDALDTLVAQRPRGEFVIYCRDFGPIDQISLLRAVRANNFSAQITTSDPGFRGHRNGQVAVELVYLPDVTLEVQGSLLVGESRVGLALVYGGSVGRYLEKHKSEWPQGVDPSKVLQNVATYAAKHEILVHHSGNFLTRGQLRNYRGNIRGDAYAQDGYLESNHPNDILWNLPNLLSPRHLLRKT